MRKIIALKDEQYNLTIARNNLFAPIVEAFKANKRRYNLLNSALIELFEYIRQEDMRTLSNYFVENFYSDFESISYVRTFRELKLRYDAHRDKRERISSDGLVPFSPSPPDAYFVVLVRRRVVPLVFMTIVSYHLIVFEKMNVISMLMKKTGLMRIQMKIELVHSIMGHYFTIIPMMMIVNRKWLVQYQQVNLKENLVIPMTMKRMNKDY